MAANSYPSPHFYRRRRYHCDLLMPPLCPSASSLLDSLITLAHEFIDTQKCSLSQRRNLSILARRIDILLMLLQDVRDTTSVLLPSVFLCFSELHVVLQGALLLAEDCAKSSRICLLLEHQKMSEFFHRISQEMATTLEILPLALLDVSCDVREQVELVRQQAKKTKLYVDAKEAKLCTEVRFAMRQIEKKQTPQVSKLREVFTSLELRNTGDCQRELERLEAEDIDNMYDHEQERKVPLIDLVSFVRYCKCVLYGPRTQTVDKVLNVALRKEPEILIPDDFRCPISLEIMIDPVILATGHTYERSEITRWIDGNYRTCPKSGLTLPHTTLTPNYALRNLIRQWCVQHEVQLCAPMASSMLHASCSASLSTPVALEAMKLTVEFLLQELLSANLDTQRCIVNELRVLAKCCCVNCKVIADAGAIPLLVPLLSASDAHTKEHTVATLLYLSIYVQNKAQIVNAGALDHLIRLLERNGDVTVAAQENALAVLFSLSQLKEAVMEMGRKPEAIEGLLKMLKAGNLWGKRAAASALFNTAAMHPPNRAVLVKAGLVEDLVAMLSSIERGGIEEEGIALLDVLINSREGRGAMTISAMALPLLVDLLCMGTPKSKESATAILLCLCRYGCHCVVAKVQRSLYGILPHLHSLLNHGTPRARRKSASLLRTLLR